MLSMKHNPPLYNKLLSRTLILGAANAFFMFDSKKNLQAEFDLISKKYFASLTDNELLNYDNRI